MSGEYKIRALGPDKTSQRTILGRFPTKCPDLKSEDEWTLKPEIFKNEISQWTLQNIQSQETYRGNPEGGLTGRKPSNYFLLIRRKGDFVAVPVDQWTTFRPSNRREDIRYDLPRPSETVCIIPCVSCVSLVLLFCYGMVGRQIFSQDKDGFLLMICEEQVNRNSHNIIPFCRVIAVWMLLKLQ